MKKNERAHEDGGAVSQVQYNGIGDVQHDWSRSSPRPSNLNEPSLARISYTRTQPRIILHAHSAAPRAEGIVEGAA